MITLFIIIYLIGFILSYAILRKKFREYYFYSWTDVIQQALLSIFSWIIVLIATLSFIADLISNYFEKLNKSKKEPPKWL